MASSSKPPQPPTPAGESLKKYWNRPVRDLVQVAAPALSQESAERHRIMCHLAMALVARYWNSNKRGPIGDYPWRKDNRDPGSLYLGHNIACIAVNHRGRVIDFDLNHNEIFNSSVEHAEARLVRRVFALAAVHESEMLSLPKPDSEEGAWNKTWKAAGAVVEEWSDNIRFAASHYSTLLKDVTLYTSLESCAQCAGIMALGAVKQVIFLQRDPDQNSIGNILFNLTAGTSYPAPQPIAACDVDLDAFDELSDKYDAFKRGVKKTPFFVSSDGKKRDTTASITSFLCTDEALRIFESGKDALMSTECHYATWKPRSDALSNREVLEHARNFYRYASRLGRRGTPHRS